MSKQTKRTIIAVVIAVVLVAAALVCWKLFSPSGTSEGAKTVTVEVTHADASQKTLELHTDAEYLWDAMYESGYIDGTDSQYGKWVTAVDGETADEANGQYWMFTKGGEWVTTSCDTTPVSDGDVFEFFIYVG